MTGDERRRHCGECALDVVNLSALTERAARTLLGRNRGERICVRYEHDVRGDIVFARPAEERRLPVAALVTALAACTANPDPATPPASPAAELTASAAEPGGPEPTADECMPAEDEPGGQCDRDDPELERVVIDVVVEAPTIRVGSTTGVMIQSSYTLGIPVLPARKFELPEAPPKVRATRTRERATAQRAWFDPLDPLPGAQRPWDDDELDPAARAAAIVQRTLR